MNRIKKALNLMTPVQRRRWVAIFDGLTVYKIAQIEGRAYNTIKESLAAGIKRAQKRAEKGKKHPQYCTRDYR